MPTPAPPISAADVGDRLVMSWAADRRQTFEGRPTTAGAAIDWPALYLTTEPRLRSLITLWAWCEANRESFRPKAEERGWSWGSARRGVIRALELIAAALNCEAASHAENSP